MGQRAADTHNSKTYPLLQTRVSVYRGVYSLFKLRYIEPQHTYTASHTNSLFVIAKVSPQQPPTLAFDRAMYI